MEEDFQTLWTEYRSLVRVQPQPYQFWPRRQVSQSHSRPLAFAGCHNRCCSLAHVEENKGMVNSQWGVSEWLPQFNNAITLDPFMSPSLWSPLRLVGEALLKPISCYTRLCIVWSVATRGSLTEVASLVTASKYVKCPVLYPQGSSHCREDKNTGPLWKPQLCVLLNFQALLSWLLWLLSW